MKAEHETILRSDPETREWTCWTDDPVQARKWRRLRWPIESATFRSWVARVPLDRVVLRRIAKKSLGTTGVL